MKHLKAFPKRKHCLPHEGAKWESVAFISRPHEHAVNSHMSLSSSFGGSLFLRIYDSLDLLELTKTPLSRFLLAVNLRGDAILPARGC